MNGIPNETVLEKRLLSAREAAAYIGQGTTNARVWLESIGARRNFGRRVVYDKVVIDRAIDEMAAAEKVGV